MLEWISTTGGPLILMPNRLLPVWSGAPSEPDGSANDESFAFTESDYQRACAIKGDIGVIQVGDGEALVLAEEVLETTWHPMSDGGILARWVFGDADETVEKYLRSLPTSLSWRVGPNLKVSSSDLVLFDSVFSGDRILTPTLRFSLPPAVYQVGTTRYSPDTDTELLLHRLTNASESDGSRKPAPS